MAAPAGEGEDRHGNHRGRYHVETWGCQMNVHDSERFAGEFRLLGFDRAADAADADVILLNTCSVREKAAEKVFSRLGRLRRLKRRRPGLLVGVAGCVAQQEQDRLLARSDVVDFVLGPRAIGSLGEVLSRALGGERPIDVRMADERFDEVRPTERSSAVRAYVTVIEGCNKSCSFCVVPFTRGRERSRSPEAVEAEVRRAVATGAREVELLGQNVNAYRHGDTDFAALLRRIDRVEGLVRLRFATSHPRELTDGVIAAMADLPRVCHHLHLPVQSGSDSCLRRMSRGYDRARYLERISRLRSRLPDVGLSTDVIVGFPGETREEFAETLRLLDDACFDQVYAFVYSPRPFTRAAELEDALAPQEKEERLQELFARQEGIARGRNGALVGRTVEVLVEGPSPRDPSAQSGRTSENRVVNFPGPAEAVGRLASVRVARAFPHSLLGDLVQLL